jgi:B12-binding domain/radical SAM domain protein
MREGFDLMETEGPVNDVTCYSLNSITEPRFREEIRDADCITIVGGPHASAAPAEVLDYADYCIVGEGEYALPKLLAILQEGTGKIPGGVAWEGGYHLPDQCVWLDAYPPFSGVKGYIEISRGCPHRCAYCQTPRIFGNAMRHRSIDQIARYAHIYRDVRFVSPNALAYGSDGISPRLEKVERLLRRLKNRVYFGTFPSEVRPEFITPDSLSLIAAHCVNERLHFGAQSGSDRVLTALSRGHTVQDVLCAVDLCRDFSLTPLVDVIVGFPFESDEDQRETLALVKEVVRHGQVHAHHFIPLPGTPLAHTKPRDILPEVQQAFGTLALHGHLTGSWTHPEVRFFQ